jgi:hypothetical protein
MELNDFKTDAPSLTVEDFGKLPPQGPAVKDSNAATLAATMSILQGGDPAVYQKDKRDILDPASRDEFIQKQSQFRDLIWADTQTHLPSLLRDPSVTDQTKSGVLGNITVKKLPPLNANQTLAEEALIADSDPHETERAAESRNSLIDNVGAMVQQKRDLSAAINAQHIGNDNSSVKIVKDTAELMAPFAEWIHYSRLEYGKSTDGTINVNLLGQKKKEIYDKIKSIPTDQRMEFAQQMIDMVTQNDSVLLPDGNDLVALQDLNRMLVDGEYSDFDRYFDNITTLIDLAGVGGIARWFKGAGKVAKETKPLLMIEDKSKKVLQIAGPPKQITKQTTSLADEARTFTENQRLNAGKEPTAESVFPEPKKNTPDNLAQEARTFSAAPEPKADEVFREALSESTRTSVDPSAPSQVVKDFNPELSRQLHTIAAQDDTGEASKAFYGTNKTEAMAKDLLPEPGIKEGHIPNKVEMKDGPATPEPELIRKTRQANGNTIIGDAEIKTIKDQLTSGLKNIQGMTLHAASMVVRTNKDATIGFTARYSPVDSGFKTAEETIDNAKFAFRHYGLQDSNFTLLERKGSEWVEISRKDARAKDLLKTSGKPLPDSLNNVDYAIGMKYDYRVSAVDFNEAEMLTTAPGVIARAVQFLDRMPGQFMASLGQGSIVQNLLDAASVIHPQIANAANAAFDKVYGIKKFYVQEFDKFVKDYKSFKPDRRALITDYIYQANLEGLKLNEADLYARGFTPKEVKAVQQWRRANDIMWYAANDDMAQTLRTKGFQAFVHEASDTKLFGRPVAAKTAYAEKYVYDPITNKAIKMEKSEIDALYEKGGSAFRIGEPTKIDGHWVDVVIAKNTPNGGYLRRIYDGEKVLAYRDGYYPVAYDANYFIQKEVTKTGGEKGHKVIASAKNSNEVKATLAKLKADDPKSVYSFKLDRSLNSSSSHLFDEGSWNLSSNSGVTSQRIRGERLGDASVDLHNMGNAHLKDPLHAVQQQIHQLSQRVAVRPFLDNAKKRWMLNYGGYLELPRDADSGMLGMPKSASNIVGKAGAPQKIVADARTNFNYIHSLENGYINLIDDGYKALTQVFAQSLGELGWSGAEQALFAASKIAPTQKIRTTAFKLFIAASPLRQAVMQRGQILMLGAINPSYAAKNVVKDLGMLDLVRYGASTNPKYVALWNEIKEAGIIEAVDAHTLIRDDMLHMADLSVGRKVLDTINAPLRMAQKVGFDAAEQDVLLSSWLAHRDLAIKAGKDITNQRVKEEILGQSRAYTLSMNRAGEMPYTQNTFGLMAQFFSFRHKAFLQGITNRALNPKDRLKLLAFTTAMFGVDASILKFAWDQIPESEPSETKQALKDGLLSVALNYALTQASGKDQAIDWGDLAPTQAFGVGNLVVSMMDTPISSIIVGGPSSSLLFGANPRLTDAFKTGMRYFNVIDDYEDPALQTKFSDVVKASLSTYSGFSSFFKARYAFATGQKLSSTGRVSDSDVTGIEATMAGLGFRTKTETGYQDVKEIQFGGASYTPTDVQSWYKELKRHLTRRGDTQPEVDMGQRILSEAFRVFGDDRPKAILLIQKEIEKDAANGDYVVFRGLVNKMGLATNEEMWQMINAMPDSPGKDSLTTMMNMSEEPANGN